MMIPALTFDTVGLHACVVYIPRYARALHMRRAVKISDMFTE